VKQIVNPVLLDDLNRPNIGGLYDPALGPSDRSDMLVGLSLTKFQSFDVFIQLLNMPPYLLYLPWPLWPY
jgi:hypothetical protein